MSETPVRSPKPVSRKRRRESGSVLVEFSLVIIPLFGFIFLIINVAWIIFAWASLQEGVREGVRLGVTGTIIGTNTGLDGSIAQMVQEASVGFANSAALDNNNPPSLNPPSIRVQYYLPTCPTSCAPSCTWSCMDVTGQSGATATGNVLQVTATVTMNSLVPVWKSSGSWFGSFSPWPLTLRASSSDVMAPGLTAPPE